MAKLDRFGGAEAWDAYCDDRERRRIADLQSSTCEDCEYFYEPDETEFPDCDGVGWCDCDKCFVAAKYKPIEIGCEMFVRAF